MTITRDLEVVDQLVHSLCVTGPLGNVRLSNNFSISYVDIEGLSQKQNDFSVGLFFVNRRLYTYTKTNSTASETCQGP